MTPRGNRAGQRRFERQVLQVRCPISPFLVTPFRRHHVIGEILDGEHRRRRVVDNDQAVPADSIASPLHQVQQFVHVPVAGGRRGAVAAPHAGDSHKQGHVPVVVDAVERMVLEDAVDGELQELEPAGPQTHLGPELGIGTVEIVLQVPCADSSGPTPRRVPGTPWCSGAAPCSRSRWRSESQLRGSP